MSRLRAVAQNSAHLKVRAMWRSRFLKISDSSLCF
jgi:hypothetical protein